MAGRVANEPLQVQLRLKHAGRIVLGPGRVELLERIARTGSISAAAREMRMSYRHAWLLVEYTHEMFGERLVDTSPGGRRGGGATLTPTGRRILMTYRRMERKARSAVRRELDFVFDLIGPKPARLRAARVPRS